MRSLKSALARDITSTEEGRQALSRAYLTGEPFTWQGRLYNVEMVPTPRKQPPNALVDFLVVLAICLVVTVVAWKVDRIF